MPMAARLTPRRRQPGRKGREGEQIGEAAGEAEQPEPCSTRRSVYAASERRQPAVVLFSMPHLHHAKNALLAQVPPSALRLASKHASWLAAARLGSRHSGAVRYSCPLQPRNLWLAGSPSSRVIMLALRPTPRYSSSACAASAARSAVNQRPSRNSRQQDDGRDDPSRAR